MSKPKDVVKQIRKATRRKFSAEDKIRIVLEGLRGQVPISDLCRRESIAVSVYYKWSKSFLESGKNGLIRDIRRTAISMWFANGMSEHDVMVLAGHSSFAATHEFYLAVADDLVDRARVATAQGLRQKLVRFGTHPLRQKRV